MSRLLRINGIDIDIDDKTAIGLDLQSYDIKEPGKPKINVSNTFTVPVTVNNLSVIGNPNDPQSNSDIIYQQAVCDYWVDNEKLIDNTKIRVEQIDDRITFFIYDKINFWENIKKDLWPDFISEFLPWLNSAKGIPIESDPFTGTSSNFLTPYIDSTEGILLPFLISNMGAYQPGGQKEIQRATVVKEGGLTASVYINVTSSKFETNPRQVSFSANVFDSATQITTDIVTNLNSDAVVSAVFVAAQDEDSFGNLLNTFTLTSIESQSTGLNIALSGTGVVDDPTSTQIQQGISIWPYFGDTVFDPLINGIGGYQFLKYKTNETDAQGGHFCVYVKTLFEFIEYKYDINLLTSGGVLAGNIWDDVVATKLFIPVRDLNVHMQDGNHYFFIDETPFLPLEDQKDKVDKKVYDFVLSFMNHMNIIKDELFVAGKKVIRFARFDDLETAEVINFSDKITGTPKYKPRIKGFSQNNYIKFKEIYPEGSEFLNSKNLTCDNLNLDVDKDLISIDAYVPSVVNSVGAEISNLRDKESFKTFVFYISDEYTTYDVTTGYFDYVQGESEPGVFARTEPLQIAKLYDLNSEYNFFSEIISRPIYREIEKWLTISDIRNFEFFKQYYIKELNGSFFINKIKGFNPDKSKKATTIELIKVSNRTPVYPPDLDYWTDGVGDGFVDGIGDYFY